MRFGTPDKGKRRDIDRRTLGSSHRLAPPNLYYDMDDSQGDTTTRLWRGLRNLRVAVENKIKAAWKFVLETARPKDQKNIANQPGARAGDYVVLA